MPAVPLVTALVLAASAAPAAAAWRPPVAAPVARTFHVSANPYGGGQHRGIDLRAAPGTPVRAPCAGQVVVADRVGTSGGVVTLLCGPWRVSHMPLATIRARAGTTVAPGARLGTLARGSGHAGLHLGVRRDGTRFGYVDPLRFLTATPTTPAPLGRAPRSRPPDRPSPGPTTTPPGVPAPIHARAADADHAPGLVGEPNQAPRAVAEPAADRDHAPGLVNEPNRAPRAVGEPGRGPPAVSDRPAGGLAPWPAWAGLALVLAGAGVRWRGASRNRTRRLARAIARLNE